MSSFACLFWMITHKQLEKPRAYDCSIENTSSIHLDRWRRKITIGVSLHECHVIFIQGLLIDQGIHVQMNYNSTFAFAFNKK